MAITSGGTLGTGANSTSNSSFTFNTATNTLAAGDFGILTVVSDNIATADGKTHNHILPSGGTGRWARLAEYTNAPSASAGVGVTTSIWLFEATGTVNTGTTITVNFSGNVTDKCCSFWKFTVGAGGKLILNREGADEGVITSEVNGANGFGSSAFAGLSNISRLYFRGLGKEANSTTDITVSSSFTAITLTRSRNNAAAVFVRGEFRIVTATGETSNPTLAVSGDTAGLFLALEEITPAAASTLTDNHDDNSPDGAKWMDVSGTGTIAETNQQLELTTGTSALGYAARASVNIYDLTGSFVYAKLASFGANSADFDYTGLRLHLEHGSYAWTIAGDNTTQDIYCNRVENSKGGDYLGGGTTSMDVFFTSYVPATHAWFRIRHETSDDTIYWDTAPSSAANPPGSGEWVNRWSEARRLTLNARTVLEAHAITGTTSHTSAWDGYNTGTTAGLTAALALTEGADTVAAAATNAVAAALSKTEGADTGTATASVAIAASASKTEGADTVASTAAAGIAASASITEAADTIAATGGAPGREAAASITEAADTVSATAGTGIAAALAVTESADTVSGTASSAIVASASITESADTISATGGSPALIADASITEAADALSSTASVAIAASASVTESADTVSSAAAVGIAATASISEAADTISSSAGAAPPLTADASITESADTISAASAVRIAAAVSVVESGDILVSTATVRIAAGATITEAADSFASDATTLGFVSPDEEWTHQVRDKEWAHEVETRLWTHAVVTKNWIHTVH
jgi:hypothetical protein